MQFWYGGHEHATVWYREEVLKMFVFGIRGLKKPFLGMRGIGNYFFGIGGLEMPFLVWAIKFNFV